MAKQRKVLGPFPSAPGIVCRHLAATAVITVLTAFVGIVSYRQVLDAVTGHSLSG